MDSGEVLFDGKTLAQTVIGYVFQNYRDALFPWKRAIDNIKYPLQIAKSPISTLISWVPDNQDFFDFTFGEEWEQSKTSFTDIMNSIIPNPVCATCRRFILRVFHPST